MSGAKEIRTKIKSIKSTQKITRAMEMVAASKMRKAQQRMLASRPYAERIRVVIKHLAQGNPEYRHPFLIPREPKRIGIIVMSSDRGLCGGLNVNLFRSLIIKLQEFHEEKKEVSFAAIGSKAELFLKRLSNPMVASTSKLGDSPSMAEIIGPVGVMLRAYENNELDALYIMYNRFVNTMSQKPILQKLLPIAQEDYAGEASADKSTGTWDYIYEPDAKELLDLLLTRFIESQVYQGVVENFASEQAARMVAMKSATENASEFIDRLQLVYNKARQAAITRELAEIVAGASAV